MSTLEKLAHPCVSAKWAYTLVCNTIKTMLCVRHRAGSEKERMRSDGAVGSDFYGRKRQLDEDKPLEEETEQR